MTDKSFSIKYERAPQDFVEVAGFTGDANGLAAFLHNLRISSPGRYIAEEIAAPLPASIEKDRPKKRSK